MKPLIGLKAKGEALKFVAHVGRAWRARNALLLKVAARVARRKLIIKNFSMPAVQSSENNGEESGKAAAQRRRQRRRAARRRGRRGQNPDF